jgi:ribosome-binding factor A
MGGERLKRMARVIREEASRTVLYGLADPRIGFCTVTKVKVAADLSAARVYVSVMGSEADRERTMRALANASGVVRRAVAPRLKTRTIPRIAFEFDPSVEGSIRVSELIRRARSTDADGGAGALPAGAGDGGAPAHDGAAGDGRGDGGAGEDALPGGGPDEDEG